MKILWKSTAVGASVFSWRTVTVFCSICFLATDIAAQAKLYTNLGPGDPDAYGGLVIRLALEKTVAEYGEFDLRAAPAMNDARALKSMKDAAYARPIRVFSTNQDSREEKSTRYVPFPIFLGIYSYRVCWVHQRNKLALAAVETPEQLRLFVHGQKQGWSDIAILRYNGYKVIEGDTIGSVYRLLEASRIDLFCRGATEPFQEVTIHRDIKDIVLDESLVLYYPLPHFLFTQADDHETAERLQLGLVRAYDDGSLLELWRNYYGDDLDRAELHQRRVFELDSPATHGFNSSYKPYMVYPLKAPAKQPIP